MIYLVLLISLFNLLVTLAIAGSLAKMLRYREEPKPVESHLEEVGRSPSYAEIESGQVTRIN